MLHPHPLQQPGFDCEPWREMLATLRDRAA
jgi:hypothetical protein